MLKTLIRNAAVITMNPADQIFEGGAVVLEGDRISYVGPEKDLPPSVLRDASMVDAQGGVVLPGCINAHTHTAMTVFRGHANDMPLWEWLTKCVWPMEDKMKAEDAYWLSLLAMAEMMAAGITTFSDMYMFMDATARAVLNAGMRAVLARGLQGPDEKTALRHREISELAEIVKSSSRLSMRIAPHAVYTCTPAYLRECGDMARQYGLGLHMHLSETMKEVTECQSRYGKRPPALLEDLGLLELPLTAAHCVHLTEAEVDLLAHYRVTPVHCPTSNLKLASGFAPVHALLQKGLIVALGTDSAASNNNLSILKEMKLAALLAKGTAMDPTALPAREALAMANRNGAMALGLYSEIGSLEPGKKADLLLLDVRRPHYYPRSERTSQIVYSSHSSDVRSLWIDGRKVYDEGCFLTLDIERIAVETERIFMRIHGL